MARHVVGGCGGCWVVVVMVWVVRRRLGVMACVVGEEEGEEMEADDDLNPYSTWDGDGAVVGGTSDSSIALSLVRFLLKHFPIVLDGMGFGG